MKSSGITMVDLRFCLRKSVTIPAACRERYAPLERPEFASWRRAGIIFAGVSELMAGYRIATPNPSEVMIIATAAGSGWAVTTRQETILGPGSLYASQPPAAVGWGIAGERWRIAWWYLRPSSRWAIWQSTAPAALLADLFTDLLDRQGALAEDTAGLLLRHLTALAAPAPPTDRFAELWREVERHPGEPWSLTGLARRLDVSVSTAQRLARTHLGTSPHQALVELRLSHARELLARTSYSVAVIAERVGYADAFTFSGAYRRWAGRPPTADR
jgi:AraC-like DNA-binding protein